MSRGFQSEANMQPTKQTVTEERTIREWLEAMDRAAEYGSRFPAVKLAHGSPAEEFARDPKGYWDRAKSIARRLATFGGITVVRERPPLRLPTDVSMPHPPGTARPA